MKLAAAFLILCALALVHSRPVEPSRVVLGTAPKCAFNNNVKCHSHDWKLLPESDLESSVKLVFALTQRNAESCDSRLMEISTPGSPKFGDQYTFESLGKIFGNPEGARVVKDFLIAHGVSEDEINVLPNNDFLTVRVPHIKAEELLGTKFFQFSSDSVTHKIIRAFQYSLPIDVAQHVDFVGNVVSFPRTAHVRPIFAANDDQLTTPDLINKIYNIKNNKCTSGQSTQSLFESLGQSFSPDDLKEFQSQYNLPGDKVDKVIGPNQPDSCASDPNNCAEANLDVQYMLAVAQNTTTTYWSLPGDSEPFLEWIEAVAADSNPPLVHSMSYGSVEPENDPNEMKRFSLEACKLGLRRVTIMISSGDDGVANYGARGNPDQCGFNPSYPASVPYITAVGATQGPEMGSGEVACQSDKGGLITTGGGFSTVFDQPSYQADAVKNYLATASHLPPASQFKSSGRAYPDVALMGHNYPVFIGGNAYPVSGTSASSPVFAALITLVNDERLAAGKKPIGFLNPILYSSALASAYNDITQGDNKCCAGDGQGSQTCCQYGFYCAKGFDPVTGLGSVNFEAFKAALVSQP
eukprot:CAMPEP_0177647164 /NCGR_PEP_ID=MMETSP0447-20121125/10156_1 /TAXON_ID=0 /ORGANISM="Stygamoeba regulata, Strain BSH-02190019" /LENGTH=580 /DNA_ID=CAMNT_0019149735 /DNA_START=8 /DNA_END=1750 /DNA_ORIENTATION=+